MESFLQIRVGIKRVSFFALVLTHTCNELVVGQVHKSPKIYCGHDTIWGTLDGDVVWRHLFELRIHGRSEEGPNLIRNTPSFGSSWYFESMLWR